MILVNARGNARFETIIRRIMDTGGKMIQCEYNDCPQSWQCHKMNKAGLHKYVFFFFFFYMKE